MKRKLGLKPVLRQPDTALRGYYTDGLPTVSSLTYPLGHPDAITPEMFGNDTVGDCAIAGAIEEIRLVNALAGHPVPPFTTATALHNYSAITGYIPGDTATDQGTDVHELFTYRQQVGIADADGGRHTVVAYAGLTPGDFSELLVALSLFEAVGLGIAVPDFCEAQFEGGQPWHPEPGYHPIEGGHYVPVVGAPDPTTVALYTWGAVQTMTEPFYRAYNTVAVVALTREMFTGASTPAGIDFARLGADLNLLDTGVVSTKAPHKGASRKD